MVIPGPDTRDVLTGVRRRSAALLVGVSLLAIVSTGCFAGAAGQSRVEGFPSGSSYNDRTERELYELVNAERARYGAAPLAWDDRLGGLAAEWSTHMAVTGTFAHRDLNAARASLAGMRRLGENILAGTCSMTAAQMHQGFVNSPPHRGNLLSSSFNVVGIGVVCGSDGRVWVTQNFGLA